MVALFYRFAGDDEGDDDGDASADAVSRPAA